MREVLVNESTVEELQMGEPSASTGRTGLRTAIDYTVYSIAVLKIMSHVFSQNPLLLGSSESELLKFLSNLDHSLCLLDYCRVP